jgi:hypothetical protein
VHRAEPLVKLLCLPGLEFRAVPTDSVIKAAGEVKLRWTILTNDLRMRGKDVIGIRSQTGSGMIEAHPLIEAPPDDEKIWRYLDFTKFASMLDTRSLFFCRLGKLDDKYEGAYPKRSAELLKVMFAQVPAGTVPQMMQFPRRDFFVNCWHMNRHESAAMWKLYLRTNEGVAVQSTCRRIADSLKEWRYPLFAGKVRYIDYEAEGFPPDNALVPALHKRKSFEHENELRIIHSHAMTETSKFGETASAAIQQGSTPPTPPSEYPPTPERGLNIPVNLGLLIEQVFVAPTSPDWFHQLVKSVLVKYGLPREVVRSNLDHDPVW